MDKVSPPTPQRESYRTHKRNLIWQIYLPISVTILLFIAASVGAATRNGATASRWAEISTIWLIIPLMFFALIFLLILAGLIYGLTKLIQITPTYTYKLYSLIRLLGEKIASIADATTKPIFFAEGLSAGIRRFFQQK